MAEKTIPPEIRQQIADIVQRFNKKLDYPYIFRYRGVYLYFDRKNYFGKATPICRLKYTGDLAHWEFAIYKYSSERYDPDDWLFPGMNHVDGTLEGALQAGLEAYPD